MRIFSHTAAQQVIMTAGVDDTGLWGLSGFTFANVSGTDGFVIVLPKSADYFGVIAVKSF